MKQNILKIILLSTALSLTSCGSKISYKENLDKYVSTMDYSDDFTIVQLNDIHWSVGTPKADTEKYLSGLLESVYHAKGDRMDLIVLNGDLFMLSNTAAVHEFLSFMEKVTDKYGCKFATTWGNHDRQGQYNANWLSSQFRNAKNSLYLEPNQDDVYGRSNYVVNLKSGNTVKWQLGMLDSGASYSETGIGFFRTYDYIRQSQADWFVEENKAAGNPQALAFYHIAQYDIVRKYAEVGESGGQFFHLEEFGNSDTENEVFIDSVTKNDVNLKGVFSAHAHNVDWNTEMTVNGKTLTVGLGVKSTYELYYASVDAKTAKEHGMEEKAFDLVGASIMTLHDNDFDLEHYYYNQEADGSEFVADVEYQK